MQPVQNLRPGSASTDRVRRSFDAATVFLHKQLWIWPTLAAIALLVIGLWVRGRVEQSQKEDLADDLNGILSANVEALDIWMRSQRSNVSIAAAAPVINRLARQVVELGQRAEITPAELVQSPSQTELRQALKPWLDAHGYTGFLVADRSLKIAASSFDDMIGKEQMPNHEGFGKRALAGQSTVSHPFPSSLLLPDDTGRLVTGLPTMYAAAPLRDEAGAIVGVLALRIPPQADFTRILQVARKGKSCETYAFDKTGLLLSESRFDDELKALGLLHDHRDAHSILTLVLNDPETDLTTGARAPNRRNAQPLTRAVAAAAAGGSGVDVDGYRDYRGVISLGAWQWLPEYDLGLVTEVDRAEAYRALSIVRATFWGLFGLLCASSLAIFAFTVFAARLRQNVRQANLLARQLGQYTLDEMIGAGGMGSVYRAHHALLRRPTAVKLLNGEKISDTALRRFEREVQITSRLNHPNTICIYDYGKTPEGVFYYAMEYLDGIDLEQLVERYGPQPEPRVVEILKQVCGSLAEAHALGLVHRDIKPANIVVNRRGGLDDYVKVLDFGLVRPVAPDADAAVTAANVITGTPLYMAPEAIERPDQVDARSDLYAVGAVGYFLLTGTAVFQGRNMLDLLKKQVSSPPQRPSERAGKTFSADLEWLLMRCLAKSPNERPASAGELAELLSGCAVAGSWTAADARAWWDDFLQKGIVGISTSPTGTASREATAVGVEANPLTEIAESRTAGP